MATNTTKVIKEKVLTMEFVQSDQQICEYLSMKWQLARASKIGIKLLEEMLDIARTTLNFLSQEDTQKLTTGLEAMRKELAIHCFGSTEQNINDTNNIKEKAPEKIPKHPTVIKAVIKGLPSSTNVTDIESELRAKGFEVEKIAQLRKFSTKSPLPLFMIQIKRSENAQDIFKLKNLIYLTVEVVPFRRRPGASQCFNCNYFNHTSKNCKMTPRCLKCEGSHKTHDCPKTERLQALRCINCNENGRLASSRQCPRFPRLKLKQKSEEPKTINQTRPVTAELSYAKVCSNETEQQMAPRGETQNQTPNEKTPENNNTPNFLNFATYINELQNLTSKFPEIFQALEDMSKTNNDIEKLNIFLVAVARSCNRASQK
ncbi:nucleic-acid-binding protein from transposon X-element [Trichonephila clavipes]|nr:nucleic-acid-binding protein from transposon X-element [Trichonephila clavipes]